MSAIVAWSILSTQRIENYSTADNNEYCKRDDHSNACGGRQGQLHVKFGATSYSAKRRYCNNNGSAPIVWARGTLRFCLCPLPFLTMRPGNKWAFISPLFVSEYRCLLSSFDCSGLFRGHIVVDFVVSAELADVQCSKCRLNFNTTAEGVVGAWVRFVIVSCFVCWW